jgi:hypothetical protein
VNDKLDKREMLKASAVGFSSLRGGADVPSSSPPRSRGQKRRHEIEFRRLDVGRLVGCLEFLSGIKLQLCGFRAFLCRY